MAGRMAVIALGLCAAQRVLLAEIGDSDLPQPPSVLWVYAQSSAQLYHREMEQAQRCNGPGS